MRTKVLILIFSITFFTNCSNDDDNNNLAETLNGTFSLTTIRGGNSADNVPIEFNNGDVIWTFNLENNTLTVEYNVPFNGGINSGTYEIELNGDNLLINDVNQVQGLTSSGMIISLSNNNLSIDFGLAADNVIREFIR